MKIFFVKIMITLGHFHVLSITEQYRWVIQTGLFSLVYIFLTANCCLGLDENLYQDLEGVLKVSNEATILWKSDVECKSSWTYCVMVVIQINLFTSFSFCCYHWVPYDRAAQYQYLPIHSISIILFVFLSIPISISIIFKRAYQYQYFINYSNNSLVNFNINTSYQYLLMILLRIPISYQ